MLFAKEEEIKETLGTLSRIALNLHTYFIRHFGRIVILLFLFTLLLAGEFVTVLCPLAILQPRAVSVRAERWCAAGPRYRSLCSGPACRCALGPEVSHDGSLLV